MGAVRAHLASLVEVFRQNGAETAIVAHRGNRRYPTTYGELAILAGRFAAELERRSIVSGERVVLWGENSAEWIACFFGCLLRGVIAVPLDAAGSSKFAARVMADVAAKMIVGDGGLLHALFEGDHAVDPRLRETPRIGLSGLHEVLPVEPLFTASEAVNEQTPFQIVFTSGTTSEPRGIVHTHRNVLVTLQPIEDEIAKYRRYERLVHPLRFLQSLPLSHVFGQFMGLWIPALLAAEVHFAEQLDPSRTTELIRRERISVLIAVPRIQQLLRTHLLGRFPGLDEELERMAGLSIWKRWWHLRRVHSALGWKFWAVISGGATLPAELETFWSRLGIALIQGYGMTETAALVTLNHPFHIAKGTIGRPLPGREVRISDDGEILVRGEMLAAATWQSGKMQRREGEWLATGDLAEESAAGDLRFLGRKGDVIVTGAGLNIHPADLERAVARQAQVRGCVVVSCEFAGGPEPVAVVLFSGDDRELQTAIAEANRGLADFQQIRRVLRWPEPQFPYTSTGKLVRRQVAQWACGTLSGGQPVGTSSAGTERDVLLELIAGVTGEPPADSGPGGRGASDLVSEVHGLDRLRLSEDLHLDSLGRVLLQSALEQRFGLELDDDRVAGIATLGELRSLIEAGGVGGQPNFESSDASMGAADGQAFVRVDTARENAVRGFAADSAGSEHWYPRWPWSWPVLWIRVVFLELIMRPLVWLLAAPRIVREPRELPDGPVLVIANHVTAYDGALILYALPGRLRRRVAVAMSGEMLLDLRKGRNQANAVAGLFAPIGYWLVTGLFNVFPLPRARGFRKSFAHAGEAMDRGYTVLIFPEGTRSRDGKLNRFRSGIGLLANESQAPVVPVALIGLGELRIARSRWRPSWFRSGALTVRVGTSIAVQEGADPSHLAEVFERKIRMLMASEEDAVSG